jgi:hypothetical protein
MGVGQLTKDGAPFVINWASPAATVTELDDAFEATFSPGSKTIANCTTTNDCFANPSDNGNSSLAFLTGTQLRVAFPLNGSAPTEFYTYVDTATGADAGTPPRDASAPVDATTD